MKAATIFTVMALYILTVAPARSEDPLAIFDGVWASINPPGTSIVFNQIAGGLRQANLPILGAATMTISDGRDNSNLKVSGAGFDCYYLFAPLGAAEMTWTRKSGDAACPATARFKKVQASVLGNNLMERYFGVSLGGRKASSGLQRTTIDLTNVGLSNVGLYDYSIITIAPQVDYRSVEKQVAVYSRADSNEVSLLIATSKYGWNWGVNDNYLYSVFSQVTKAIGATTTNPPLSVSVTPVQGARFSNIKFSCISTKSWQSQLYTDKFVSLKYLQYNRIGDLQEQPGCAGLSTFDEIKRTRGGNIWTDGTTTSLYITNEK